MSLNRTIKACLIFLKRGALLDDSPVYLLPRVVAVGELVHMNAEGSAQSIKAGERLDEKERNVTKEEQLQRLEEGFAPAGEVLRGEQARLGC